MHTECAPQVQQPNGTGGQKVRQYDYIVLRPSSYRVERLGRAQTKRRRLWADHTIYDPLSVTWWLAVHIVKSISTIIWYRLYVWTRQLIIIKHSWIYVIAWYLKIRSTMDGNICMCRLMWWCAQSTDKFLGSQKSGIYGGIRIECDCAHLEYKLGSVKEANVMMTTERVKSGVRY